MHWCFDSIEILDLNFFKFSQELLTKFCSLSKLSCQNFVHQLIACQIFYHKLSSRHHFGLNHSFWTLRRGYELHKKVRLIYSIVFFFTLCYVGFLLISCPLAIVTIILKQMVHSKCLKAGLRSAISISLKCFNYLVLQTGFGIWLRRKIVWTSSMFWVNQFWLSFISFK